MRRTHSALDPWRGFLQTDLMGVVEPVTRMVLSSSTPAPHRPRGGHEPSPARRVPSARALAALCALAASATGCWFGATPPSPASPAASRGSGRELVLPPELGEAVRLRALIATVPVIGRIDEGPTPVVLRGRLPRKEAAALLELTRAVHRDVTRRFVRPRTALRPAVDVVLFTHDESYQALATGYARVPAGQGFYRPDARVAAVNLARGRGNLRHELVHPLIVDDFPQIPAWLNEGIASMYGGARRDAHGRFRFLANYRLRDLQRAVRRGLLPSRDEVALAGRPQLYGADGATFYAVSQHVVLYLQRTGQLESFYRAVRDAPARRAPALAARVDWPRFVAWSGRLREGQLPPPP
jgi:hypothetical protein